MAQGSYEALARENEHFRQVLESGEHARLVVMTLAPGEEIGEETHEGDQILFFADAKARLSSRASRARFSPAITCSFRPERSTTSWTQATRRSVC